MPITQNKRRIKVQHVIGEGTAQVDVVRNIQITRPIVIDGETELIPVTVRKIVDVDAEIVELDYEILPNKVIVKVHCISKFIMWKQLNKRMML